MLSTLEGVHLEGWKEYVAAQREAAVAEAMLMPSLMVGVGSDMSIAQREVVLDSLRSVAKAQFDAALPKLSLVYSGAMTEESAQRATAACKIQVDILTDGTKQLTQMSTYTARLTDDGKLYVETTKLSFEK